MTTDRIPAETTKRVADCLNRGDVLGALKALNVDALALSR